MIALLLSLWGHAASTLPGAIAVGVDSVADSVVVFQLPLAGETVQPTGTGILVQAGKRVASLELVGHGPQDFRVIAEPQGYGYFSARTLNLARGRWALVAIARDSAGKILARGEIPFYSGSASKQAEDETRKVQQSLYVTLTGGYRAEASEGTLRKLSTLERTDTGWATGESWKTLDRNASYSGLVQYDFQRDQFRLRTRASSDLAETWGHAPSPTRLGLDLYWGPWAEGHLGDQNPSWSEFLMDGTRVRGLGVGLAIPRAGEAFARADAVVGQLQPAIDPQVRQFNGRQDTVAAQWARNLQAAHVGIGTGSPLAWNLTIAHAIDDTTGVDLALHDSLQGVAPRENLAIGSDLLARFGGGKFEVYAQGAMGLTTEDLRRGDQTDSASGKVDLPDFSSGLFTVNLSTKGSERFAGGNDDSWGFFVDNLAFKSGVRTYVPLASAGRSRVDLRFVHVGPLFESFTRSMTELSRTGMEWTTTTNLARDRVLVLVSGSEVMLSKIGSGDVAQHSHSGVIHWLPADGNLDLHMESGRTASGGGDQSRLETWNAGTGASGFSKHGDGSLTWRMGYAYIQSKAASAGLDDIASVGTGRYQNEIGQHQTDGAFQWRPVRDLELRLSYQFGQFSYLATLLPESVEFSHRGGSGFSLWALRRKLLASVDFGLAYTDGAQDLQFQSWDQTGRIQWEFVPDQVLRFSEHTASLSAANDLRMDLQWEAWF